MVTQLVLYYQGVIVLLFAGIVLLAIFLFIYYLQESAPSRALDIGCSVGRSSFELASDFEEVVGIDYSQAFIDKAIELKEKGTMQYRMPVEGDIVVNMEARINPDIVRYMYCITRTALVCMGCHFEIC